MAEVKSLKSKYPERELTPDEVNDILQIKDADITATLIEKLFARNTSGADPKYRTNDYFKLPTSRFNTSKEVYTTVGIYIFNVFIIEPRFKKLFGYFNKPVTGDNLGSIESKLSRALYDDKITTEDVVDYLDRIQWLGGDRVMSLISPSYTPEMLRTDEAIIKKRDELFKKYAKELDPSNPNNAIIGAKIEKELVSMANENIKHIDGSENYDSGAGISIGNNYKNMYIAKGATTSSYDGKTHVNKSNYATGITKDEYTSFSDSAVMGSYMRAINTASAGYLAKQLNQALQAVTVAERGSDCHTQKTLRVFLYPKLKDECYDRYIVVKSKGLVRLTDDNWSEYENTWVEMRSPMYCLQKEPYICNICAGDNAYKMNILNYGGTISRIGNTLLNISLKSFHDQTKKLSKIKIEDLFIDYDESKN